MDINEYVFSEYPAAIAGFSYGFLDSFCSNKNAFKSPLSSVFCASLNGMLYTFGSVIVSGMIPRTFKPVLPIVLVSTIMMKHPQNLPKILNGDKNGENFSIPMIGGG